MSNAQESIVKDLEARQTEIQESIQNAVRSGGESMKLRHELKSVQQQLQNARNDVATMRAHGRQLAARTSAQIGDELAGDAVDRISGASVQFGEILAAGIPALNFSGSAAVAAAAHNVAAARQRVADAEAIHTDATAEADKLATRKAEIETRRAEIGRQRISGETGEGSAAELYALGEDSRTISELHAAAKVVADGLVQPVHEARIALRGHEKHGSTVEFRLQAEHLASHARALDAALVECLRATQAAGMKAGVGIGALFQTSLDMRTFISTGAIPQPFRR